MMRQADPIGLMKAVLWEEAKGKLRALVAASGAEQSRARPPGDEFSFEKVERAVEEFIEAFENDGLHE